MSRIVTAKAKKMRLLINGMSVQSIVSNCGFEKYCLLLQGGLVVFG